MMMTTIILTTRNKEEPKIKTTHTDIINLKTILKSEIEEATHHP